MSSKSKTDWINVYMMKVENKYEISDLALKIFNELGSKFHEEDIRILGKIILEHFLLVEAKDK